MDREKPLVSVILVNFNGMLHMKGLVESLDAQSYAPLEVLVFDNGSTDGSVEYLRRHYPKAMIVMMGRNTGFSRPNNLGIRMAKGRYILALNIDLVLEKDFIEHMVRAMESEDRIGWVAGKMLKLTPEGRTNRVDSLGHHMSRERVARSVEPTMPFAWEDYNRPRNVFGASACAALYRREMLEDIAVNGEIFDEDFFAYFEDVDLDWRAQQRGWTCRYTPDAVGYHLRHGSGLIRSPYFASLFLSNRILMIVKNDVAEHLREDSIPILRRTWADGKDDLVRRPWVVVRAVSRVVRLLPKMYRKRRVIAARRLVSTEHLRRMIA